MQLSVNGYRKQCSLMHIRSYTILTKIISRYCVKMLQYVTRINCEHKSHSTSSTSLGEKNINKENLLTYVDFCMIDRSIN